MPVKQTVCLRDGRKVVVRDISPREDVNALRGYYNALVKEGVQIMADKTVSIAEERKWLKRTLGEVREGTRISLVAQYGGRIVSICFASRDRYREKGNVFLGIGVAKDFRGAGLGFHMMNTMIGLAKRRMKPKLIYLTHFETNKPARQLYEFLGFREVARLPNWIPYKGKRVGKAFMVLRG